MLRNNILIFSMFFSMFLFFTSFCSVLAQDNPVTDFQLLDVNTTSVTYNIAVSPRDFRGSTSAWYFSYAT